MRQYHEYLRTIQQFGNRKGDRTGVGTVSRFGCTMRFDLDGCKFPLLTTKKMFLKGIIAELLWMISGDTNVKTLQKDNVRIWDEWANQESGELGPVYGAQWRKWEDFKLVDPDTEHNRRLKIRDLGYGCCDTLTNGVELWGKEIDQLADAVERIKTNPNCRRNLVSAWNPGDVPFMSLPCCHVLYQFNVWEGYLSCCVYQRSCDSFLGVPFNIASYAALTMMIAKSCDLKPRELIWNGGDCHIYNNHEKQIEDILSREPRSQPYLNFEKRDSIFDYKLEDFTLEGYDPHPPIKADVAV